MIALIHRIARDTGRPIRLDRRGGKGSHAVLWLGDKGRTVVQHNTGNIPVGTLRAMFRQLGLDPQDYLK